MEPMSERAVLRQTRTASGVPGSVRIIISRGYTYLYADRHRECSDSDQYSKYTLIPVQHYRGPYSGKKKQTISFAISLNLFYEALRERENARARALALKQREVGFYSGSGIR